MHLYHFILICTSLTVILQWLVWRKVFEWRIWASLVPIVGGILLTSITELSFDISGFCAALFGCLATSTKTILAESLLHGYKFDRYLSLCFNVHNIFPMKIFLNFLFLIADWHVLTSLNSVNLLFGATKDKTSPVLM